MKKLILSFFFAIGLIATTHAQCVPVNQANAGFSTVADSMPCYIIGQAISGTGSTLYFKSYDTVAGLLVDYMIFDSITNLPAVMSYSMNKPLGTQYQNGEKGCISLFGSPTGGCGQYRLGIYVRLKIQGLPEQTGELDALAKIFNAPDMSYIMRVRASSDNCPCIVYEPSNTTDSVGVTKPGRKACTGSEPECPNIPATNNCTLTSRINLFAPDTTCSGDSILLLGEPSGPYNHQWLKDGQILPGETGSMLQAKSSGDYQVQVDSANCLSLSSGTSLFFLQAPAVPVLNKYGSITSCTTSNISLHAPGGYSYLWSNGGTNDSIQVRASDEYTVTITGANGCTAASAPYPVNLSFLAPYQICAVTVDSITGYNTIVWEKHSKTGVDSFYVYKKTPLTKYEKIGAVGVNDLSIFSDVNSDPQQENAIYKICARDTCGIAALSGDIHKTIYLSTMPGLGGVWQLSWSQYVGFTFPSYNIYRGTSSISLQLIATVPSGTTYYEDANPPANERYYQIEAVNPNGCLPTAKTANYSASKSNTVIAVAAGIENTLQNDKWAVYPNPTSEMVVLAEIANMNVEGYSVKVTNAIGQVVMNKALMNRETKLNTKEWGNGGMYFFHILDTENRIVAVKKIIVQ